VELNIVVTPIPPKDYDGTADSRAYHRFVMEGETYLRDGKVPRERHIRILAYYLEGKAYNFYTQKVAFDDPNNWSVHKFFTELFNYCFPVDYRQRMRIKLEELNQKYGQPVSEFVFELQELFSMVGAMPTDMKVVKLWYSLNARIQRALWRDGLHPDSSTWDEVVAKAEVIEIADNVFDRRDGTRPQVRKGCRPNNSKNNHKQNYNNESSQSTSQSMAYTSRGREGNSAQNNNNGGQSHADNRPRQNLAHPSGKRNQGGNSSSKSKGTWKGSAQKKSVKFADLSEKEMAQLRAEGKLLTSFGHKVSFLFYFFLFTGFPENNENP
jgi:hypothetical protein